MTPEKCLKSPILIKYVPLWACCDDFGTCYVLADIAKYLANLYVT